MRRLAKNELRLLIVFSTAVFVALNLFAVRAWMQHRGAFKMQINETRSAIATGESWINASNALQTAREWIDKNPAPISTPDDASTKLLNTLRSLAEKSNLKVTEETLLPPENSISGPSSVLQVKLTGPFPGVASLLYELQNPSTWRSVDKILIRSDNEPPNVIMDLLVRQYYRAPTSSASTTGP